MKFTILGGTGFVGKRFAQHLSSKGYEVVIAPRDVTLLEGQHLGHCVYILGLTGGDAAKRPHDAIEAHVTLLSWVLQNCDFESFVYASSTRVYSGLSVDDLASENKAISLIPNAVNLFDVSKLLGESLCQRMENPKVRIARLSNVYGAEQSKSTFLGAVVDEVKQTSAVTIHDSPESVKDYIAIDDVCEVLEHIILRGNERLYNIASGMNVECKSIAQWIEQAGYDVSFSGQNLPRRFAQIDVALLKNEFEFVPRSLQDDIRGLLEVQ